MLGRRGGGISGTLIGGRTEWRQVNAVRECIQNGQIEVHYVPTKSNPADIFTKSLPKSLFFDHLNGLGIKSTDNNKPGASSSISASYGKSPEN